MSITIHTVSFVAWSDLTLELPYDLQTDIESCLPMFIEYGGCERSLVDAQRLLLFIQAQKFDAEQSNDLQPLLEKLEQLPSFVYVDLEN